MEAPQLKREVELPRQRSNGAAVVLVAAMAMFTAVAASAFVVRVRMHATQCPRHADHMNVEERQVIAVDVIGAPATVEVEALDPFHAAIDRGDDEAALEAYLEATPTEQDLWRVEREAVAKGYIDVQLDRLKEETDTGSCAEVAERLQRLARLLPEHGFPTDMATCTKQRLR